MRNDRDAQRIWILRIGVLAMAVVFIIAGILRREYLEVFQKAVKICLECFGLGQGLKRGKREGFLPGESFSFCRRRYLTAMESAFGTGSFLREEVSHSVFRF